MVEKNKGKDKALKESVKVNQDDFMSFGKRKPYSCSGTAKTLAICIPAQAIKLSKYEDGDMVDVFINNHGDLLIRFGE